MATNFPTSLDSYSDVATGDTIQATTTNNVQDAVEALQAKVGIDSSAVTSSVDYQLRNLPAQESALDVGANNLTVDTDTLFVDAANDRVGINTNSPHNNLHVVGGDSGVDTANEVFQPGMIIEGGGTAAALSILTPNTQIGRLYFGDPEDVDVGGFFYDHSDDSLSVKVSGNTVADFDANGALLIGDSANSNMTTGITINQGGNDDEILALKSSDVAHGMTDIAETDTFGFDKKLSGTNGGRYIAGLTEATTAVRLAGMSTTGTTTKSTSADGNVAIFAYQKSGTNVGLMGANENLLVVKNYSTTRFIFDAEGTGHADDSWTTYSDRRIKDNIAPIPYGLDALLKLEPIIYDKYSGDIDENGEFCREEIDEGERAVRRRVGFIAQDVYEIAPEVVRKPSDPKSLWSLDYDAMTPILAQAIKDLAAKVSDLEAKVK